jgi:hypothetical protein
MEFIERKNNRETNKSREGVPLDFPVLHEIIHIFCGTVFGHCTAIDI